MVKKVTHPDSLRILELSQEFESILKKHDCDKISDSIGWSSSWVVELVRDSARAIQEISDNQST